jgi:chromosomal replication initiation ATPase DnaA
VTPNDKKKNLALLAKLREININFETGRSVGMNHLWQLRLDIENTISGLMTEVVGFEEMASIHKKRNTMDEVLEAVSKAWDVSAVKLAEKCKKQKYVLPRHACYFLMSKNGYGSVTIGRYLGGRDHSTVIHGRQTAQDLADTDKDFSAKLMTACGILTDFRNKAQAQEA